MPRRVCLLLLLISIIIFAGCGPSTNNGGGGSPPSEVRNLQAVPGNDYVILKWSDPPDTNFAKVEISFAPEASGVSQPIEVVKGTRKKKISGLSVGASYTFTLKAVNQRGGKSKGVTIQGAPDICIVHPEVICQREDFEVKSACIGKSYSTSSYIYGVVEFEYTGEIDLSYLKVTARFYGKDGLEPLFQEKDYIRNPEAAKRYTAGDNFSTFVTPEFKTGYFFIIENLAERGITVGDIAKVDLHITSDPFKYEPPVGKLDRKGSPYRVASDSWYWDIENTGERVVELTLPRFIFKDDEGSVFYWTFLTCYINHNKGSIFKVGDSGYVMSDNNTPDYIDSPLKLYDALLCWEPRDSGEAGSIVMQSEFMTIPSYDNLSREERDFCLEEAFYRIAKEQMENCQ